MLEKLRERTVEFVVVTVLLAGLLYAASQTYRNSTRLEGLEKAWTEKEKSLETRFSDLRSKYEIESKGMRKVLVALMVKSGSTVEELQTIVGSSISIQQTLDELNGLPPRRVGSDLNLKENIRLIARPQERLNGIRGVTFDWQPGKTPNGAQPMRVGVIAQEVELVFPELVSRSATGFREVDYAGLVAVLVETSKSQQEELIRLRAELDRKRERPGR